MKQSVQNSGERPVSGLSTWIGKNSDHVLETLGEPERIEPSSYGYDWWVYPISSKQYIQLGIEDSKVVTLYTIGDEVNVSPYKLGQKLEDIYRFTIIESEIVVNDQSGSYQFELNEEDLNTRLLVSLGDIYAQLYLDKFTGELMSIRFLDGSTLIKMHPYEMMYRGELVAETEPTDEEWTRIDTASEKQIYDITNVMRTHFEVDEVDWNEQVANVARGHSEEMYEEEYFSHESPVFGNLSDRLEKDEIPFKTAGENIASQYTDAPEAVHGWLNSEGHRKILLEEEFTDLGVGVYKKYYTQNFIEKFNIEQ
ncbi:CAP domain-containing protein [Rossellomorea aquimaris]|uniref:CAP domain-containing protein n=1 Tax=Rossellomorea aquimaris TaxID=189382 RepID=UPI001CD457AC|nr:CAP domain-containing protein [Rossellomorea aquimaris]MCA1053387.1 CAP domain-containing protein [Rossellomorea aquimaris]